MHFVENIGVPVRDLCACAHARVEEHTKVFTVFDFMHSDHKDDVFRGVFSAINLRNTIIEFVV